MANVTTTRTGGEHGSARSYNLGFALSAILTIIPFMLVMHPVLSRPATLLTVVVFAVAQLIVQLVYFLHMSRSSEGGWNLISFAFTLLILLIIVALSVWIIWSMHYNMMVN
ncbi:cytochrome o ubiquinol oxidase subunit IV [Cupriavidus lacunae]|uniref:Cytochrome bo(3) ubiquinol oxidase subunit 4 n=1 Tax=Cupriavidus lacunae TaxID=2666307 RepID=A0A370NMR1_9BURK|nr:cytochrome o ubiquinol oxidase subunit IV [Cupriavidus lacunae]RDK06901.1 cytochrome o ubiquinol oxidase subunit IV [Cupriavidus lacunae]